MEKILSYVAQFIMRRPTKNCGNSELVNSTSLSMIMSIFFVEEERASGVEQYFVSNFTNF